MAGSPFWKKSYELKSWLDVRVPARRMGLSSNHVPQGATPSRMREPLRPPIIVSVPILAVTKNSVPLSPLLPRPWPGLPAAVAAAAGGCASSVVKRQLAFGPRAWAAPRPVMTLAAVEVGPGAAQPDLAAAGDAAGDSGRFTAATGACATARFGATLAAGPGASAVRLVSRRADAGASAGTDAPATSGQHRPLNIGVTCKDVRAFRQGE